MNSISSKLAAKLTTEFPVTRDRCDHDEISPIPFQEGDDVEIKRFPSPGEPSPTGGNRGDYAEWVYFPLSTEIKSHSSRLNSGFWWDRDSLSVMDLTDIAPEDFMVVRRIRRDGQAVITVYKGRSRWEAWLSEEILQRADDDREEYVVSNDGGPVIPRGCYVECYDCGRAMTTEYGFSFGDPPFCDHCSEARAYESWLEAQDVEDISQLVGKIEVAVQQTVGWLLRSSKLDNGPRQVWRELWRIDPQDPNPDQALERFIVVVSDRFELEYCGHELPFPVLEVTPDGMTLEEFTAHLAQ